MSHPQDFFTPAKPASPEMFAARVTDRLQQRVEETLREPGRQLILFGWTGVGKTTLVRNACERLDLRYIREGATGSLSDVLASVLSRLDADTPRERTKSEDADFKLTGGVPLFKGSAAASVGNAVRSDMPRRTEARAMIEAMERQEMRVLFIDNFEEFEHHSDYQEVVRGVGVLLKEFSDRASENNDAPKLVIAGIPAATEELVVLEEAVQRRTSQVEVPRMAPEEMLAILSRDPVAREVEFDEEARTAIVEASDGFPYYTHLFARQAVARAVEKGDVGGILRRRVRVTKLDFDEGVGRAVLDAHLRLRTDYAAVVERAGEKRPRKDTLEALAALPQLEASLDAVRESYLKLHPENAHERLTFISQSVNKLTDRGVLVKRKRPGFAGWLIRFSHPLMRAYVRIHMKYPTLAAAQDDGNLTGG